jgi:hypothetical protein
MEDARNRRMLGQRGGLAKLRKSGLDSPDNGGSDRNPTPGQRARFGERRYQCPSGGAGSRSSPAAAKRGIEDAGLEVGHASPDHQTCRSPPIASLHLTMSDRSSADLYSQADHPAPAAWPPKNLLGPHVAFLPPTRRTLPHVGPNPLTDPEPEAVQSLRQQRRSRASIAARTSTRRSPNAGAM